MWQKSWHRQQTRRFLWDRLYQTVKSLRHRNIVLTGIIGVALFHLFKSQMNLSQKIFSLHDKCQLPGQKYPTFAGFSQVVQAMMEDALETLEKEPAGQAVGEPAPGGQK